MISFLLVVAALSSSCGSNSDAVEDRGSTRAKDATEFVLEAPSFVDGRIPPEHSLAGANRSPELRWRGVPAGTRELALTVVDPDASNFVHWVVVGIPPDEHRLRAGGVPPEARELRNQFGQLGWGGPAPPPGSPHTYVFTLYALREPSGIPEGADGREAIETIEGLAIASAVVRGEYEQPSR